jgi:hypothetical protein
MMRMTLRPDDSLTSLSTRGWYKLQLNWGGRGTASVYMCLITQ